MSFQQPLHLRSEMDIAAALTDVLTTRMKPPPKPPRDLYPSTAFWLLLTGVAIGLLVLTLFKPVDYLMAIQYIAVAQIVIGYIWIVVLVFRRNRSLGIKCAIPVITPWYLIQKRFRSYRPLRFVLTGALLLLCTVIAPRILADTRQFSGADQSNLPPPQRDIATLPEVEQLREYREKRQFVELINLLRRLDHMDPLYSKPAPQRVELAAELRRLVDPTVTTDSGLRAEALPAYARWAKDDARDMVLAAMQGHPDERRQAIQLLYKWPGPDVARVLASRLGNREESELVKKALINIGGPVVVQALIPLLRDKERDKMLHLAVLDLMTNPSIGNEEALQFLRVEKDKFTDESLNRQVEHTILKINENLRQKRGG